MDCVYTLDQVDSKEPVKKFPTNRDYLKLLVRLWQRERLLLTPKSRRMTISWAMVSLNLWRAILHRGQNIAFVSRKEGAAGELVDRAKFIYEHIPEDKIPSELLPRIVRRADPPRIEFPDLLSKIEGYPMGADQLRQYTFSSILGDEAAFWEQAEDFYAGSKPTTDGGGSMQLISTPAPGFYKKLVFDTINESTDVAVDPEVKGIPVKKPMEGIRIWRNPGNRFLAMEIHYTADPEKRGEDFRQFLKDTLPRRKWLQEYELYWDSFSGLPVFEDFDTTFHLSAQPIKPEPSLPLLCGVDFGMTPAVIVAQLIEGQLRIIKEFTGYNQPISTFLPEVLEQIKILYPNFVDYDKHYRWYIDPAGIYDKNQTDARTCQMVMSQDLKLRNITPGAMHWEPRKNAIEHFLTKKTKHGPGLILHEPDAPMLSKGFKGGYHYPESVEDKQPNNLRPVKDEHSHPHDALQYLASVVKNLQKPVSVNIAQPSYNFGNDTTSSATKKEGAYINGRFSG